MELIVRRSGPHEAVLECDSGAFRAATGLGGIGIKRAEGDGITPVGVFPVRHVLYRADRISPPPTGLMLKAIALDDGWCDAPEDPAYNRPVKRPYHASSEALWRDDALYDLVVVLGYNDAPVVPGAGSAIFLHVARTDYGPTQGCIALARDDLLKAVSLLGPGATIAIRA
jgi:L,D-peptidoglycan transpeptidase YkuD (ErfK/YbiS/YcfS/YnhG family)